MRSLRFLLTEEGRISGRLGERPNEEWLELLRSAGRDSAIDELRLILIRGLRFALKEIPGRTHALEQVEDFAQEGLLRILDNLDSFRGESRFTTWAQKIALRVAFSELRRKRWENTSLDSLLSSGPRPDTAANLFPDPAPSPEEHTSHRMAATIVTAIINNELTALQREAIQAIVLHGVPMEEAARQMRTNRNALYKLLHDARKKVRAELARRGLKAEQIIAELG